LTGPPAHLQEAIDWSFRLLSPAHQILFARLGVFASGCTLDAAAAVCAADDADLHALAQANLIQITAGIDGAICWSALTCSKRYAPLPR
jgi:predicted ATPase